MLTNYTVLLFRLNNQSTTKYKQQSKQSLNIKLPYGIITDNKYVYLPDVQAF